MRLLSLIFAGPLDSSFSWFQRRFDIEKLPTSALGFVAGVFVALIWTFAVAVSWGA
jgi:hypothetical protein